MKNSDSGNEENGTTVGQDTSTEERGDKNKDKGKHHWVPWLVIGSLVVVIVLFVFFFFFVKGNGEKVDAGAGSDSENKEVLSGDAANIKEDGLTADKAKETADKATADKATADKATADKAKKTAKANNRAGLAQGTADSAFVMANTAMDEAHTARDEAGKAMTEAKNASGTAGKLDAMHAPNPHCLADTAAAVTALPGTQALITAGVLLPAEVYRDADEACKMR